MGHIYGFVTCTRNKWEATVKEYAEMTQRTEEEVRKDWQDDSDFNAESDTIRLEESMEEHGWVDRSWNSTVLHDSRNDVRPIVASDELDVEYLTEDLQDAFSWLGAFEDNGDGTFYASESDDPFDDPWTYSYALHFTKKECVNGKWIETPWHPERDGGFKI